MIPRPLDLGPITTLTNLGKYPYLRMAIVWTLFAYNMAFGKPVGGGGSHFYRNLVGVPHPVLGAGDQQHQANIPLLNGLIPDLHFPGSTLVQ